MFELLEKETEITDIESDTSWNPQEALNEEEIAEILLDPERSIWVWWFEDSNAIWVHQSAN